MDNVNGTGKDAAPEPAREIPRLAVADPWIVDEARTHGGPEAPRRVCRRRAREDGGISDGTRAGKNGEWISPLDTSKNPDPNRIHH
jgi:hypothetical protein